MALDVDPEGFLRDRSIWTPEIAVEIAAADGRELTDEHMNYITQARKMFDDLGTVPPIRKFIKDVGVSKGDLFAAFETGPMKLICKWGGLPKPTGCV